MIVKLYRHDKIKLYTLIMPFGEAAVCVLSEKGGTKHNRVSVKRSRVAFAPPSISIGTKVKGRIRRLMHKQRDTRGITQEDREEKEEQI